MRSPASDDGLFVEQAALSLLDQGGCFLNGTVASTPKGISCLPTPTPWLAPRVLIRSSPDLASPAELSLVNRVTDRC